MKIINFTKNISKFSPTKRSENTILHMLCKFHLILSINKKNPLIYGLVPLNQFFFSMVLTFNIAMDANKQTIFKIIVI